MESPGPVSRGFGSRTTENPVPSPGSEMERDTGSWEIESSRVDLTETEEGPL